MYIIFAISFTFSFSIVGLFANLAIKDKSFYRHLENFNFIKSDTVNRYLGIVYFKEILLRSFWRQLNPTIKITKHPDRQKLISLRNEMTSAEIGHLIAFICVIIVAVIFKIKHFYEGAFIPILISNIIFHTYPVLLQQYNKRRLDKVIDRFKS